MDREQRDTTDRAPGPQDEPGPGLRGRKRKALVVVVAVTVLIAAAAFYWFLHRGGSQSEAGRPVPAPSPPGSVIPTPTPQSQGALQPQPGDLVIVVSQDKIENAQIKVENATQRGAGPAVGESLRTTGSVASDQYRETPVFPIAGGIIREVNVQLGDQVKRGQPLLTIFSTELANAQGDFLRMKAEYEEHEKEHHRTQQLLEIGAASREELEQSDAKVESMRASIAAERQELIQLGMTAERVDELDSPEQVNSMISVPAPVSGTVISRTVNSGEVVATGKELLRIADLSQVWVLAQVYEKDFSAVRQGMAAAIGTPAYPGRRFNGHISYIDPRVDPQTRTAQVRIELPNPGRLLKIGMFVDVVFGEIIPLAANAQNFVALPAGAVQEIGNLHVVYIAAEQPGFFVQRRVTVGPENNGVVPIYSGVGLGDRVVTDGSFLLRAESLKQKPQQVGK